jgi:hypothetical protein
MRSRLTAGELLNLPVNLPDFMIRIAMAFGKTLGKPGRQINRIC